MFALQHVEFWIDSFHIWQEWSLARGCVAQNDLWHWHILKSNDKSVSVIYCLQWPISSVFDAVWNAGFSRFYASLRIRGLIPLQYYHRGHILFSLRMEIPFSVCRTHEVMSSIWSCNSSGKLYCVRYQHQGHMEVNSPMFFRVILSQLEKWYSWSKFHSQISLEWYYVHYVTFAWRCVHSFLWYSEVYVNMFSVNINCILDHDHYFV